jgi:hypothetical protein
MLDCKQVNQFFANRVQDQVIAQNQRSDRCSLAYAFPQTHQLELALMRTRNATQKIDPDFRESGQTGYCDTEYIL